MQFDHDAAMSVLSCFLFFAMVGIATTAPLHSAQEIVKATVEKHGGTKALYHLRDVEYRLTRRFIPSGLSEVSTEAYLFDGERSRAIFTRHAKLPRTELFDGVTAHLIGASTNRETFNLREQVKFARKANYFLFLLPFKLADQEVSLAILPGKPSPAADSQMIEVRYPGNDSTDRHLVFINKQTGLIQAVLLRTLPLGGPAPAGPFLVEFDYDEVNGLMLATRRRWFAANEAGMKRSETPCLEEQLDRIQFWNGFIPVDFAPNVFVSN